MKPHDIAHGPRPADSNQPREEKPGSSTRFFRDVLTDARSLQASACS